MIYDAKANNLGLQNDGGAFPLSSRVKSKE